MTSLDFPGAVMARFHLLTDLGFNVVETLPTLVRYRWDELEVRVYQGRLSSEIGLEIVRRGVSYGLEQLIHFSSESDAAAHRYHAARTPEALDKALNELEANFRRFGLAALDAGDDFFARLDLHAQSRAEDYALDVLASQIRPRAEQAFRASDYATASQLYDQIERRLTPAEKAKLVIARERSKQ